MTDRDDQHEEQTTGADTAADTTAEATEPGDGADELARLRAAVEAARADSAHYKDKYLREYADKENFRKRQERITADRIRNEKRDLLLDVLEVTDNLDRAMAYQETMDRDAFAQTLRMMQWQLNELLTRNGLSPVPAVGSAFDPHVHDAIEAVASDEHAEGTVVEEVRKGYRLGDETLRPARVKVSTGPVND